MNPKREVFAAVFLGLSIMLVSSVRNVADAATVQVQVALADDSHFLPKFLTIEAGDTVQWVWGDTKEHSVTSGDGNTGVPNGIFDSGIHSGPFTYSHTF